MKRLSRPAGRSLTLDELLEWMKACHPSDRRSAVSELGSYTDPRIVEPLIEALDDPDPGVRSTAAHSLGRLGRKPKVAAEAKQAVEQLLAMLEAENEESIASAIYALGELGDDSVGPRLLSFLDYPDTPNVKMRSIAILALRALRYQAAIPYFCRLLRDPSTAVRNDAILALFSMRDIDSTVEETLKFLVDDPDPLLSDRARSMMEIIAEEKESE
jgi:HEAT repeat protein